MQIAFEDKTLLRGDFVLRAVQRFDLTPIPSTLELTIRADDSLGGRVADGSVILAGSALDRYRIVKVRRATTEWIQGQGGVADVLECTAILDGFTALAWPLQRAVIKEGKSLGEIYRSCGATARVVADIPTGRFTCFAGQYATLGIAQLLQEEAAAAVWKLALGQVGSALSIVRLADLFTGRPVESIQRDTTRAVESSFLERQEIPWAMSTDVDGNAVLGRRDLARGAIYLPRTAPRVLDNMTRCLVVRRTLTGTYAGQLRAGDGLDIAGVRHVIATVAHTWAAGTDGGPADQSSRMWLAQLSR